MKKLFTFLAVLGVFVLAPFATAQQVFPDVPEDHPNFDAIMLLYDFWFIDGNPDGSFAPDRPINRAEFLKILTTNEIDLDNPMSDCFDDVPNGSWYEPYVCYAKDSGVVMGVNNEGVIFRPEETLNTAEILAILGRYYGWETDEPWEGEEWFAPYMYFAEDSYVLPSDAEASSLVNRAQFAELMARTETMFWLEKDTFDGEADYLAYYEDDTTLTEADCFEGEVWNPDTHMCDWVCEEGDSWCTDGVWDDALADDLYDAGAEDYGEGDGEWTTIVQYDVMDGVLDYREGDQSNSAQNEEMWEYFTTLVPEKFVKEFVLYEVFTDGKDGTMGAVQQSPEDYRKWVLQMDAADAYMEDGSKNVSELSYTLIHEFAHVLTLRNTQIELDKKSFELMNAMSNDGDWEAYADQERQTCPTYYPGEGCAREHAYIYAWYTQFWDEIYDEYRTIGETADDPAGVLYETYQDSFVSDYAATNPEEDIAESFTYFVMQDKPTGNSIWEQKVQFFYNYPELVAIRNHMRKRLIQN